MNKKPTYLTVKDHSVSGEDFQLVHNEELDMLETIPQPSANTLSEYYKSEDYISHTDSKRNWFEKAYHFVRGMALKRKLKLINSFPVSGKTILDVGSGTGDFLQTAKNNSWNVYGIEPNEKARAIANSKTKNQVFDTNTLQEFESGTFDVITLWHVLEHLPNLETEIQNLNRLLKPEGRLVIAVPNFKSYDAKHYNAFWAAYDVPRHLWHFSQTSISKLFSKNNLEIEKTLPMTFDAFYVSLLSEQYKSGSKNPLTAFWIGLQSNLKAKRTGEYSSLIYVLKKS
ncbi:methyltransferase [Meridianimaribacter sp. CL38]|uniref:class I SAM-dependent methyltransferase n=1 Tax=Meridianimaribacter sp. CL38 TaxID=2213021 RepID=UPI00103BA5CA|nr:class I SAM-dependent methyltransferase [Meridianimaribacter sp. CL38]TBV28304.1 methyltransferase [Meridianimaribacter sp. CL38]